MNRTNDHGAIPTSESSFRACVTCGADFEITEGEIATLRARCAALGELYQPPVRCRSCRQARRAVRNTGTSDRLICTACRGAFFFEPGEKEHYARLGFPAPIRCPSCRETRRALRKGWRRTRARQARD